jgi:peptidoglycan/LPS O-acetylase OafA/YrhL
MGFDNETDGGPERLEALDGLRGVAILLVLCFHITHALPPARGAVGLYELAFRIGWTGVDLFFVLSGFLITRILLDTRDAPHYFRNFYARRALRILPLYYGVLVLVFLVPQMVRVPELAAFQTSPRDQLWYWFYLQNFHPLRNEAFKLVPALWSLAVEEQFYLFWPLALLLTPRRHALSLIAVVLLGGVALRLWGVLHYPDPGPLYFYTPARLDGLALGAAIAAMARDPGWPARRRTTGIVLGTAGAALLAMVYALAGAGPTSPPMLIVGYPAIASLAAAALIAALGRRDSMMPRLLRIRSLRTVGKYSYGMYVLHQPVILMLRGMGLEPGPEIGQSALAAAGYTGLVVAATMGAAWCSWHGLEKYFLRWKHRFPYATVPVAGPSARAA